MRKLSERHAGYMASHLAPVTTETTYYEALEWINDCTPTVTISTSCRMVKLHDNTGLCYKCLTIESDTLEDAVVDAIEYIVKYGLLDGLTIDDVKLMEGDDDE